MMNTMKNLGSDQIETLLELTPLHSRTSCDDLHQNNNYPNDQGTYRCTRCFLLDAVESGYADKSAIAIIDINVKAELTPHSCSRPGCDHH